MKKDLPEIKARGFDLININLKQRYNMQPIFNWKTTAIGVAIVVVKFLGTTLGLSPDLISSIVTILTAILGYVAGDGKNVQTISQNK